MSNHNKQNSQRISRRQAPSKGDLRFDVGNSDGDGCVEQGRELSMAQLVSAYAQGVFPWYNEGQPISWFCPDPRLILLPEKIKVSKSLKRNLKKFEVRFDTCFSKVIRACAATKRKKQSGTWITTDMTEAYIRLHQAGVAHSVESFFDGKLVGGLYGLALGSCFFGESMFAHKSDASKVALVVLAQQLFEWDFDLIDCQVKTDHLLSIGAHQTSRSEFLKQLRKSVVTPSRIGSWTSPDQIKLKRLAKKVYE